jgi:ribose 5-phosphate isomerase B
MEKLFIASDHAAFNEKEALKIMLEKDYDLVDLGADSAQSTHYPIYAKKLARAVLDNKAKGIILCGSGIGVSITVNRFKGIRGSLCRDTDDAIMTRKHNDSNVLCLAGRKNSIEELKRIAKAWLATDFEGGRHQTRIEMID